MALFVCLHSSGTTAAQTYVDLNSNEVVGEVSCNGSEESLTDCTNSILQCPNTVAVASCSGEQSNIPYFLD